MAWIAQELGAEVLPGNAAGLAHYRKSDRFGVSGLPFLPHKTTGEGLFMAVLRKTADEPEVKMCGQRPVERLPKKEKGGKVVALQVPKEMKAWVQEPETMRLK